MAAIGCLGARILIILEIVMQKSVLCYVAVPPHNEAVLSLLPSPVFQSVIDYPSRLLMFVFRTCMRMGAPIRIPR